MCLVFVVHPYEDEDSVIYWMANATLPVELVKNNGGVQQLTCFQMFLVSFSAEAVASICVDLLIDCFGKLLDDVQVFTGHRRCQGRKPGDLDEPAGASIFFGSR